MTAPFWAAAERHQFILQRCAACGAHQFYPRPFCLVCGSAEVAWVPSAGRGTIYAQTTVHVPVIPELEPPYVVALVQLDEGPRYTAGIVGGPSAIGDRAEAPRTAKKPATLARVSGSESACSAALPR